MRVAFAPSFLKQLNKLDPQVKANAKVEARAGLRIRVIYLLTSDELKFVLVGTHDAVKRYLHQA